MSENCGNCGAKITEGSTFKMPNLRKLPGSVAFVNFISQTDYIDFCDKCYPVPLAAAYTLIDDELAEKTDFVHQRITDFPMFTVSCMPSHANVMLKNMITANVTVGTGFFSEFSQSFSDLFGMVNVESGMSYKVNKGEASARSIIVRKALSLNANCVIGVDIDYGTTGNNAATINMQGTAAVISNLDAVLHADELSRAKALIEAFSRIVVLRKWRSGKISPEDVR